MSHVAKIEINFTDLECLERAAKACGLVFNWGQTHYRWYGHHVGDYPMPQGFKVSDLGHCEHAISVPGNSRAYEVGVCRRKDGEEGYTLLWDFWAGGNGLQKHLGGHQDCNTLIDAYSKETTLKVAAETGMTVQEEVDAEGATVLTLYDYSS